MAKTFICCCEDILVGDIEDAIDAGHTNLESLKRYTGFGTGICQGKNCVANVARVLSQRTPIESDVLAPFTPRPPVLPIPLHLFAASDDGEEER